MTLLGGRAVKRALELKLGTQLSMTPQLQQAIRLLQMSSVELRAEIQAALEQNPLLDFEEITLEETLQDDQDDQEDQDDSEQQSFQEISKKQSQQETPLFPVETLNANTPSLRDHLFWQMQLTPLSETDRLIASAIIDAIDEDGFLTCSLEDIIATLQPQIVDMPEVEAILHRIQQFDPVGVGSRNLEECLKIQINHLPQATPWHHQAQLLITHYLLLLGKHDYATLRRRLKLRAEELNEVIHLIQTLNPRPGTQVGERHTEYIVPDAFTFKRHGKWIVELNKQLMPKLSINDYYASIINANHQRSHQHILRQQLQEAKWFLKSIETRNTTLQKVLEAIVAHQTPFLEHGNEYMRPLILQDIASELEMHESTISRITTQKYIHTPLGTFELKHFFSNQVNKNGAKECSPMAVQALIKKLIAHENPHKPLSDQKIALLLAEQGVTLARRTIAKYREELHILPSNERKQL